MATRKASKKAKAKQAAGAASPAGRGGRPTIFTATLAERVLAKIVEGKSLRAVCAMDTMPARSTVLKWLAEDDEFSARYARACAIRAEGGVEEILEIADNDRLDPQDKKVRIDARKWIAVKLLPKKYGDKVEVAGRLTLEQLVGASMTPAE